MQKQSCLTPRHLASQRPFPLMCTEKAFVFGPQIQCAIWLCCHKPQALMGMTPGQELKELYLD